MAKQVSSNGHNKPDSFYSTPDIFTTSTGEKVRFIGLNQQRLEVLRNAGKLPPVPQRVMITDFGGEQKEDLTENDLQNDEEKILWQEYIEKKKAVENKRDENVMKYTFTSGFEVLDLTDEKLNEWKQEEEEVWGNEVPGNRVDILLQYINTRIIGNNNDYAEVMAGIMERTGVPPEMLDELRESFRHQVRRNPDPEAVAEPVAQG